MTLLKLDPSLFVGKELLLFKRILDDNNKNNHSYS